MSRVHRWIRRLFRDSPDSPLCIDPKTDDCTPYEAWRSNQGEYIGVVATDTSSAFMPFPDEFAKQVAKIHSGATGFTGSSGPNIPSISMPKQDVLNLDNERAIILGDE